MTDMPEYLATAEAILKDAMDGLSKISQKTLRDDPDKAARTIATLLKALKEVAVQREASAAQTASKTHTRYEDMPPPTPEDEARFYARFRKLVGLVDDAAEDAHALACAKRLGQSATD